MPAKADLGGLPGQLSLFVHYSSPVYVAGADALYGHAEGYGAVRLSILLLAKLNAIFLARNPSDVRRPER
jgi:hypothetical protein